MKQKVIKQFEKLKQAADSGRDIQFARLCDPSVVMTLVKVLAETNLTDAKRQELQTMHDIANSALGKKLSSAAGHDFTAACAPSVIGSWCSDAISAIKNEPEIEAIAA